MKVFSLHFFVIGEFQCCQVILNNSKLLFRTSCREIRLKNNYLQLLCCLFKNYFSDAIPVEIALICIRPLFRKISNLIFKMRSQKSSPPLQMSLKKLEKTITFVSNRRLHWVLVKITSIQDT